MELRSGAFEDQQTRYPGANFDALSFDDIGLGYPGLVAIAEEGMRMWLAVDDHPCPSVDDDLDVSSVDVFVCFNKVRAEDGGEEFGGSDGILLGHDVGGILHGVCGDHNTIVCFGVSVNKTSSVIGPMVHVKDPELTRFRSHPPTRRRPSSQERYAFWWPHLSPPCTHGYCPFRSERLRGWAWR